MAQEAPEPQLEAPEPRLECSSLSRVELRAQLERPCSPRAEGSEMAETDVSSPPGRFPVFQEPSVSTRHRSYMRLFSLPLLRGRTKASPGKPALRVIVWRQGHPQTLGSWGRVALGCMQVALYFPGVCPGSCPGHLSVFDGFLEASGEPCTPLPCLPPQGEGPGARPGREHS